MRLRHYRCVLAALTLVAVLAGCSPLGDDSEDGAISAASLSALVLQPDDLSEIFTRFDEGPLAIADAPAGERADPERFGRAGGWKARYRRSGSTTTRGPLVVESRVDLFDGSGGAGEEFETHTAELEGQASNASVAELREVAELGEDAVALVPAPSGVEGAVVSFIVVWRDRNVVGSVVANGFDGKLVVEDVLELARDQQRRIEAAGSSR